MNKTILIIEDDPDINAMLQILLRHSGYEVVGAYSGTEGLLAHSNNIDLILLDLMLPGKSGEEIIRELKNRHNVPVIVISAVHDINKKVQLFDLGADDYVTKPFHNDELLARISARFRSENNTANNLQNKLNFRDIEIDRSDFSVKCCGNPVDLSYHEFALLCLLMENPKRTCTKSMIYDNVWDNENSADDNTLNVHISKIRKKLKQCNPECEYIETVWGIGYRMKQQIPPRIPSARDIE